MRAATVSARSGWRKRRRVALTLYPEAFPPQLQGASALSRLTLSAGVCRLHAHSRYDGCVPQARPSLSSSHPRLFHLSSAPCSFASLYPTIAPAPATTDVSSAPTTSSATGLFGITTLRQPADFIHIAVATQRSCQESVDRIVSSPQSADTLQWMDDISDALCRAVDVAELIRNIHPSSAWRTAAEQSIVKLSAYMETLNQHVALYAAMKRVWSDERLVASFTAEQHRVAHTFVKEMEQHGITLSSSKRAEAAGLQAELLRLMSEFTSNVNQHRPRPGLNLSQLLDTVPEGLRGRLKSRDGKKMMVDADTILKWSGSERHRQIAYVHAGQSHPENLPILQHLVACRDSYARLLGFPSYTHYHVSSLFAKTPEFVSTFLHQLLTALHPYARQEMDLISQRKKRDIEQQQRSSRLTGAASSASLPSSSSLTPPPSTPPPSSEAVQAWDGSYYMGQLKASLFDLDADTLTAYFSLSNCIRGIDAVFQRLFGCEVRVTAMQHGEDWTESFAGRLDCEVVKLEVVDTEKQELVGVVYLDLFERPSKFHGGAAFVVQSVRSTAGGRQLPVMTVVAGFSRPAVGSQVLFTHGKAETLFHEIGHVTHHIFCRNRYQHLSGARGELDFVELPSILFENFIWDYRVLRHFAFHHRTGAVIPQTMVDNLARSRRLFFAIDTCAQAQLSLFDQQLFGSQPLPCSPSELLDRINEQHPLFPSVAGVHFFSSNIHLCHYGAGYYTYLMCRVFAAAVWNKLFHHDPLSREAGREYVDRLLQYGGAKQPREILTELLGADLSAPIQRFIDENTMDRQPISK